MSGERHELLSRFAFRLSFLLRQVLQSSTGVWLPGASSHFRRSRGLSDAALDSGISSLQAGEQGTMLLLLPISLQARLVPFDDIRRTAQPEDHERCS